MSMFARYLRDQNGLRRLVELLETTPLKRREELIKAGAEEDPEVIALAMEYIITFRDIIDLDQMELTEVLAEMKPKAIAFCALSVTEKQKQKILDSIMRQLEVEVNSYLEFTPSASETGQARLTAIKAARSLEAANKIGLKKIPRNQGIKELIAEKRYTEKKAKRAVYENMKDYEDAIASDTSKTVSSRKQKPDLSKLEIVDDESLHEENTEDLDDLDFDGLFGGKKDKKKAG